jgi:tetratricopeptide (TPR) repeat protein
MPAPPAPKSVARTRWLAIAAMVAAVALVVWFAGRWRVVDPLVGTPMLVLEAVAAKTLFFNAAAHPWLRAGRADLLPPDAMDAESERVRAYVQAVENPRAFRQLDRQHRFDALLLVGNPSGYRPLLDHLVETKDFQPVYVDHWAILFRRDAARAWQAGDLAPWRERLAGLRASERAACLAEVAVRLTALRRGEEAKALLDEAEALDGEEPTMWNGRAVWHSQRGEWKEALACADRALRGTDEPLAAVATKAQALYAMKEFAAAFDLSQRLVKQVPEDPGILFYHAKIAHEARAFRAEIEALEKLIALAEAARRPVSGYCIYLGQAYAAVSDGKRSVAAFERALSDPELPKEQREFAEDNIRRIKTRVDL